MGTTWTQPSSSGSTPPPWCSSPPGIVWCLSPSLPSAMPWSVMLWLCTTMVEKNRWLIFFQCFQSCLRSCCKHRLSFKVWRIMVATMSLVSIILCILVMIDPDVSHFYLTCLGREELFRYVKLKSSALNCPFLFLSNATFAPQKHVQLFSNVDILCRSVTTPLISTQSWVLVARSSKAPSGIQSGSTDFKH